MSRAPLVVVIPTHDRSALLNRTLDSIAQCELPEMYEELVVIENGSRAGAQRLVAALPSRLNARYMHRERGNKSYALNEALHTIADGFVVFFDDDVRVTRQVLAAYAKAAEKHGPGHFFGGPVNIDRKKLPPDWVMSHLPYSAKGYDLKNARMENEYLGLNWAVFASDIRKLGGFDPRFGPGSKTGATGQESDMQRRMVNANMKTRDVHNAVVWHYVPECRSDPRWLLSRHYKMGVYNGLSDASLKQAVDAIAGLSKYCMRLLVYMLLGNRVEVFNSRLAIQRHMGMLRGIDEARTGLTGVDKPKS